MKVQFWLIALTLFSTGCGRQVPNDFRGYLDSFLQEAHKRGIEGNADNLSFDFGKLQGVDGECKNNTITIDPDGWKKMTVTGRELLMFPRARSLLPV
jgi:hypothetical protein